MRRQRLDGWPHRSLLNFKGTSFQKKKNSNNFSRFSYRWAAIPTERCAVWTETLIPQSAWLSRNRPASTTRARACRRDSSTTTDGHIAPRNWWDVRSYPNRDVWVSLHRGLVVQSVPEFFAYCTGEKNPFSLLTLSCAFPFSKNNFIHHISYPHRSQQVALSVRWRIQTIPPLDPRVLRTIFHLPTNENVTRIYDAVSILFLWIPSQGVDFMSSDPAIFCYLLTNKTCH